MKVSAENEAKPKKMSSTRFDVIFCQSFAPLHSAITLVDLETSRGPLKVVMRAAYGPQNAPWAALI